MKRNIVDGPNMSETKSTRRVNCFEIEKLKMIEEEDSLSGKLGKLEQFQHFRQKFHDELAKTTFSVTHQLKTKAQNSFRHDNGVVSIVSQNFRKFQRNPLGVAKAPKRIHFCSTTFLTVLT
jgi:hypothetical protein